MRCIRCGADSAAGERTARRCPRCGGEAAFDPREGDPVSDDVFARTIARTSAEGTLFFHPRQLYYDLCRTLGSGAQVTLPPARFDALWDRWCAVHGTPPLTVKPWPARDPFAAREADLGDYSFDRVVITDTPWMVDFLLCNNFHFETNSAVLGVDGYPEGRFAPIRAMLHRNPRILVIALHEGSAEGCALPHRLVTEDGWFRDHGIVIDVGLGPAHRAFYPDLWQPRTTPVPVTGTGPDEVWLAHNTLELGVLRPEKAMRRLFRATRVYNALRDQGPPPGQIHADPMLFGPGPKQKREETEG